MYSTMRLRFVRKTLLSMGSLGMNGMYRGVGEDALLLIDHIGADLWVVQSDTHGPFAEASSIPQSLETRLLGIRGVREYPLRICSCRTTQSCSTDWSIDSCSLLSLSLLSKCLKDDRSMRDYKRESQNTAKSNAEGASARYAKCGATNRCSHKSHTIAEIKQSSEGGSHVTD